MFRGKSKSLLFIFNEAVSESIHSFFCVDFICIWFKGGKIVGVKLVRPWRIFIKPQEKFDKFLEIPCNDKNFNLISKLIDK
jgi:hypothetical protein